MPRLPASLAALALVAGCSASGPFFGGAARDTVGAGTGEAAGADGTTIDPGGLAVYLELMQRLADGDEPTRAEAFIDARDAAGFAPTTSNRLSYAVALSVPGHAGSDPAAAADRLRDLAAAGDALLPEERMLVRIQLRFAERLEALESNSAELEARLDAARASQDEAALETIRGLEEENARLQRELQNATEMLDAITSIEESLSEREEQ